MKIEIAINEFMNRQANILEHSKNTLDSYKRNLNKFNQFLLDRDIDDVNSITKKEVMEFLKFTELYEKNTQNQIITTLRQFFNDYKIFHVNEQNQNPMSGVESIKTSQHLPIFLSENEMKKFLNIEIENNNDILRKAIFELLYCGGLRVSECANLQLGNLHLSSNMIRFIGKGSKERVVILHNESIKALEIYLTVVREKIVSEKRIKSNYLFIKKSGKVITRNDIYRLVKERRIECNIDKAISPHSLRHSYATHMLEEGANLVTIQELLGHSDIKTTQIYTHVSTKKMKSIYDQCFPVVGNNKK